nr:hypothetical protein [Pseudomonas juntendi]
MDHLHVDLALPFSVSKRYEYWGASKFEAIQGAAGNPAHAAAGGSWGWALTPSRPGTDKLASCGIAVTLIARWMSMQVAAWVLDDVYAPELQRFLAKTTQDTRGFQANMFNGARQRANDDEVADLEENVLAPEGWLN